MLDVTDNIVGRRGRPPAGRARLRRATTPTSWWRPTRAPRALSDTANAIAIEYGFWLGDAFASGGSKGYDHKALGITARGAWESVKRHFRELGPRRRLAPVHRRRHRRHVGRRVRQRHAALGQIQLVAAFDHRHVFLDPTPDAAASFAERERLFELGAGTSWMDYDRAAISAGGGVFPRTAKSVAALARGARGARRSTPRRSIPTSWCSAILRAPVDLLWNGGIGTFVKASSETNAEVGDRDNDAIRVNGRELRARVVGEGGNLGFTQRGRIEYATGRRPHQHRRDRQLRGRRLLGPRGQHQDPARRGRRGGAAHAGASATRCSPRRPMRSASSCCYDNYLQVQILSQEQATAPQRVEAHEDDDARARARGPARPRHRVRCPSTERVAERQRSGRGADASRAGRAAGLREAQPVPRCWPRRSRRPVRSTRCCASTSRAASSRRPASSTAGTALRREIVATVVTNDVVNSLGIAWVWQMMAETGAEPAEACGLTGSRAR